MGGLVSVLATQVSDHPFHIFLNLAFAAAVVYLLFFAKQKSQREKKLKAAGPKLPSEDVQEKRIAEFESELFHPTKDFAANTNVSNFLGVLEVESRNGYHVTVKGGTNFKSYPVKCVDLATYDFHSFSTNPTVVSVARTAVNAYGVGSCGPRGFYGTVKPHLDLETDIAKFLQVEDAIIYSFSFATISTLISCYATRGDYTISDICVSLPVQEGISLSRSNASYYRHNDMAHLEELMRGVVEKETAEKKLSRRFVITEGVFRNTGDICDLQKIVELCDKYKFRVILDDSFGFGVIGASGRGTPEYLNVPMKKVDIYVGSLSTSLGAVGGFCAGEHNMVDYQRLAAAAYVFSASLPPYMTSAASASLGLLAEDKTFLSKMHTNAVAFREALMAAGINETNLRLIPCTGNVSPIVILRPSDEYMKGKEVKEVEETLENTVGAVQKKKVLILRHLYNFEEKVPTLPALRVVVKSLIPVKELEDIAKSIVTAVKEQVK